MPHRTRGWRKFLIGPIAGASLALISVGVLPAARAASDGATARMVAAATAETATYVAEIAASGPYRVGSEGTVLVTLTAKGGYHINPQYPYKFKASASPPDGLSYPKPVLGRADGVFEASHGSFRLPISVTKAGTMIVSGTLHLSVCSPTNCVVDKLALELPIEVK